ncbi:MAG TPA: amidohydrolase family protein [Gemmataceae bacterium]|nr:amidohydrolase family protein [Gemmataceae bacterium]
MEKHRLAAVAGMAKPLRGRKMGKSPTRIALVLAAGGLLGLLAASRPGPVEQPPKQGPDGAAQHAPAARPPAKVGARQPNATLFKNVKVFDGKSDKLTANTSVLVVGNKIEKIGGAVAAPEKATVIDAGGRVLMPGLIDAHWHAFMASTPQMLLMTAGPSYLHLLAARQAEATLMRGFTTVRDCGGPVFGLKRAIDEGVMTGPRIYPSGAFISQTSGHGDFRWRFEVPRTLGGPLSNSEVEGVAAIADSPDEVRLRTREQLRKGASQIKLMAGGGIASPYNPIESTQFTEREVSAAVEAAENWGTYVTVHAYTPRAIRQAVAAGVKCVEHGHLIDEPTAKFLAEKGIWWSLQPLLEDEDVIATLDPVSRKKARVVFAGTDNAYKLAKKYKAKTAFGSDVLFDANLAGRQGALLAKLVRWYTPAEALKMATADNGDLMALSGFINPYPGKLGVVEEGALADLLLVDGNPIENIKLIADPAKNFVVIMKDGRIYKNLIRGRPVEPSWDPKKGTAHIWAKQSTLSLFFGQGRSRYGRLGPRFRLA